MAKRSFSKLFRFSRGEWELLGYLAGPGPASEVIRDALRQYARHLPAFDAAKFLEHCRKEVLPDLDGVQRKRFEAEMREYERFFEAPEAIGSGPTLDDHVDSAEIFGS